MASLEKLCDEAKKVWGVKGNAEVQDQRNASAAGIESTMGDSPPPEQVTSKEKTAGKFQHFNLNVQQDLVNGESEPGLTPLFIHREFHIKDGIESSSNMEHQFIPSFPSRSPMHQNNEQENKGSNRLSAMRNGPDEEIYVSLQLGEPEPKRRKHSDTCMQY